MNVNGVIAKFHCKIPLKSILYFPLGMTEDDPHQLLNWACIELSLFMMDPSLVCIKGAML